MLNKKNLFLNFIASQESEGVRLTDTLNELNSLCGTKYKSNWPSVMEERNHSTERIPTAVRKHMMRKVLPHLIPGLSQKDVEKIIDNLT